MSTVLLGGIDVDLTKVNDPNTPLESLNLQELILRAEMVARNATTVTPNSAFPLGLEFK